jgi:hypothetical protein
MNKALAIEAAKLYDGRNRRPNMALYHTRYFGDFEADDDNDLIEMETSVRDGGEDTEISIIIHYSENYKDRMDEIVQLLDKYFELHEAVKRYIGENYEHNEDMIGFLFKYAGQLGKKEYVKNGNKRFSVEIDKMIEKLEPPSIGFQVYKNGTIAASLSYYGPDFSLIVDIDKDGKVYHVEYFDQF